MEVKSVFASKTLWVNVISGLALLFASEELKAIAPNAVEYFSLAVVALNIVLRYVTVQPVSF